jgi:methylmalonyl-CoA/ethylmalonyl-CoA epimerase
MSQNKRLCFNQAIQIIARLLMEKITPVIKITSLVQVSIIVNDLDASMKRLWETFGIGPWRILVRDPYSEDETSRLSNCTYYGKSVKYGYKTASTINKLDGMILELTQPTFGPNIFSDFLKERGEGIQHLGWYVVQTREEFKEAWGKLEAAGYPCIQSGTPFGREYAFFDTTNILGTVLEMLWCDPSVKTTPNYIFPKK